MRNLDLVGEQRRGMARTHLGDIRRLDREIKANKTLIRQEVTGSDTTVTDVYGVGPIVAAFLIGYTGDIGRFASANHYAAYNGTAPDGKQVPPCPTLGKFAKAHNDWYRETLTELLQRAGSSRSWQSASPWPRPHALTNCSSVADTPAKWFSLPAHSQGVGRGRKLKRADRLGQHISVKQQNTQISRDKAQFSLCGRTAHRRSALRKGSPPSLVASPAPLAPLC